MEESNSSLRDGQGGTREVIVTSAGLYLQIEDSLCIVGLGYLHINEAINTQLLTL